MNRVGFYEAPGMVPYERRMAYFLQTRHRHDAIVIVGEQRLEERVHKLFFDTASVVFREHFENQNRIELADVKVDTFRALLRYVYLNEIQESGDSMDLFQLAVRYKFPCLMKRLENAIRIDLTNVLQLYDLARANNQAELERRCFAMINENAAHLFQNREILQISEESFLEILRSDNLRLDNELQAFQTVQRFGESNGRAAITRFIPHIRFPLMSPEQFAVNVVRTEILSMEDIISVFMHFELPLDELPYPGMRFSTRRRDYKRLIGQGRPLPDENFNVQDNRIPPVNLNVPGRQ